MGVTFQGCVIILRIRLIAWPFTKHITIPLLHMLFASKSRLESYKGKRPNIYDEKAAGNMQGGVAFIGMLDE